MAANKLRVHGIPNCDMVKKARAWLGEHAVRYDWVDFRASPPSRDDLSRWSRVAGWDRLLNRRGTTWRTLDREQQSRVHDEASAIALMLERPTLIKRPVIETGDDVVVGFDAGDYAQRFG
jgi:arsenate reductase